MTADMKIDLRPTLKELKMRYKLAHAKLADFDPMYAKIAIFLDRWTQQNFRSEGGKVGGWVPLKLGGRWLYSLSGSDGKRHRTSFDTSAKILQDTGRLRASFYPFTQRNFAGVGSDMDYAEHHQEGWGPLPERRMVPNKEDVIKDVMKIADKHTKQSLKKGNLK